jgi:signal transduction histidine kinase/DNA-binding response OmpR family regulator
MKILVADDEVVSRSLLARALKKWGHEVTAVADGLAAWQVLRDPGAPRLAILDWEMPGLEGPEVCRKVRTLPVTPRPYLLLLTAREGRENIAAGLRAGANDYLAKPFDPDELRVRLDVAASLLELETLEATSRELERRVQERTAELAQAHAENERLLAALPSILIGLDEEGRVTKWNKAAADVFALPAADVLGRPLGGAGIGWEDPGVIEQVLGCGRENRELRLKNVPFASAVKPRGYLDLCATPVPGGAGTPPGVLLLGEDRTEQRHLEVQLAQAQKLESIGQLAAGIAHEINTPIQYVGDNTTFLRDSFAEYGRCLDSLTGLLARAKAGTLDGAAVAEVEAVLARADLEYLSGEVPSALEQAQQGIDQVAHIVRSMKEFSHPGGEEKTVADLNRLIETTITVARNEWKYVADVVTDLDPGLPAVPCLIGEFNQVVLNLLVNAAHAVSDRVGGSHAGQKGTITVTTRSLGDRAEVRIADTGTGIPEAIRAKVFDPFFTTKAVGKGTGQGLAIAHAVIVKKHGGELTFETEVGKGTTFIIRLPFGAG